MVALAKQQATQLEASNHLVVVEQLEWVNLVHLPPLNKRWREGGKPQRVQNNIEKKKTDLMTAIFDQYEVGEKKLKKSENNQ